MFVLNRTVVVILGLMLLVPGAASAQVTFERLLNAADEPHNWLTYSGSYSSHRHSTLDQITPSNVEDLELKWVFQARSLENFAATPLVVDGVMYVTQAPNDVVALDARTGRVFWVYEYVPSTLARPCCGRVNRGVAILGNTLFMATIDAKLIAIDAVSGGAIWQTEVGDPEKGYAMTLAPLVVEDKVIVGVAGGEYGIRGYVAAYDAATGEEVWRFYTIPGPGEPGHETWGDDSWEHGGAPVWLTGSYDPDTNQTFWGIGNPGPDWNPSQRPGDNLYSDSVVALDADSGELQWYFQFTPNDPYDYDAVQIPVLVDVETENGGTVKAMFWANRNGFFYALDRTTGRFLLGRPFVDVNWAAGLDDSGRPIPTPQPPGATTFPGVQGGTNWYSPSYNPNTGLFYLSAWENYGSVFTPNAEAEEHREGQVFLGGRPMPGIPGAATPGALARGHVNEWTAAAGTGAVIALDPLTGEKRWKFEMGDVTSSGVLSTSANLLFTGGREGYFFAIDAEDGEMLWRTTLGAMIHNGPMTYAVDNQQFVAVAAGNDLFVFGLRESARP
jgi:alcohol dehydrogenase (cytochrome c)